MFASLLIFPWLRPWMLSNESSSTLYYLKSYQWKCTKSIEFNKQDIFSSHFEKQLQLKVKGQTSDGSIAKLFDRWHS